MTLTAIPAVRPVYFPFTFLSSGRLSRLERLFRSISVLQPGSERLPEEMQPFAAGGFLAALRPGVSVDAAVRDYLRWGDRHREGVGVVAAWRQHDPPGRDADVFEIAAELRRRAVGPAGAPPADDLHEAALFLHLAQTGDQQRDHVARSLHECDRRHHGLFEAVRGEASGAVEAPFVSVPADDGRLPRRMAAWARVFLACPCRHPVFVTHSRSAVEWLCERVPQPRLTDLAGLPETLAADPAKAGDGFCDALAGSLADPAALGAAPVRVWPGMPPNAFVARALGAAIPSASDPDERLTVVIELPEGESGCG